MSKNSDYAKQLARRFRPLPSAALKAVGRAVYTQVLQLTRQDSGEAAFNWIANINNTRIRPYMEHRGIAPVGSTGEKRSATSARMIVIDYRLTDFLARVTGKDLKDIMIYNPIEDEQHERNALIQEAGALATGQDMLTSVAEMAVRRAEKGGADAFI